MHAQGVEEALEILKKAGGEVSTCLRLSSNGCGPRPSNDVWPKVAEKSERNAKGVALWKEFLKDIGHL